jgi:cell division protein FtsB
LPVHYHKLAELRTKSILHILKLRAEHVEIESERAMNAALTEENAELQARIAQLEKDLNI